MLGVFIIYMPNPIKYSTGTETLALKKGNFYIGTGAVGKGPTSETGYYNGITPPTGGYTIYLNKETGGPSIYTASNDAELISLTNSIANQSYTGTQQCFDYFYGQTDKLLVNQDYSADYPYIAMDGLVLNLDAGITQSYPGSGTVWTDVNGLGPRNNGTLTNGPTFNSDNGGSIVFDGADDYISLNNPITAYNTHTIDFWFYNDISKPNLNVIISMSVGNGYSFIEVDKDVTYVGYSTSGASYRTYSSIKTSVNSWRHFTVVKKNSGDNMDLYLNGVLQTDYSGSVGNLSSNSLMYVGTFQSPGWPTKGRISSVHVYNRILTSSEILQNYNAQKGRFGL
jgi:hypothetical protein